MTTLSEAFQTAVRLHQAGQLSQAQQIYQQILQANPRHAPAMHLLGVVAHQTGQHAAAVRLISDAIRLDGARAGFHVNLGEAQRALGKLAEAKACYEKAIALEPKTPQAHYNLALVCQTLGPWQAVEEHCREALTLKPDYVEAHNILGNALRKAGDDTAARACYKRALELNPNYAEALINVGILARQAGDFDEAVAYLNRALAARPDAADVPYYLGLIEAARNRWPVAVQWYQQAVRLSPDFAEAETHLGIALQAQDQIDEAIAHYQRALQGRFADERERIGTRYNLGTALGTRSRHAEAAEQFSLVVQSDPDHCGALTNLGAYYQEQGDYAQALSCFDRVLRGDPDSAQAHYNRGLIRLSQGELAGSWNDYQWRLKLPKFPMFVLPQPLWDGSCIPDKTLLVHYEQGLGDTIQFVRYLELIRNRCGRLLLKVQNPLVPLLAQSGFADVVVAADDLPPYDCQIPLMSLPQVLGTTWASIPASVPYLSSDSVAIADWRARLAELGPLRVGITWKGSSTNRGDQSRSIPLSEFAPLAGVPGVRLISLQKREGLEQLGEVSFAVHQLGDDFDETAGPFMDTAAVMKNLDLVITADTATAHLAGALAVPVWLALSFRPDWRWTLAGDRTPWYPTMRLFRQIRPADWAELFARIAVELAILASDRQKTC